VIFHAYDDALCIRHKGGADAVFICGGTIRGDSVYGPGEGFIVAACLPILNQSSWEGYLTVGNVMEILPFQDPIVVLQMDGSKIWTALESSLSTWPAQEG
jgi:5'-nucleotidase